MATPETSLMRAHYSQSATVAKVREHRLTSTGFPDVSTRTSFSLLRSHMSTSPSMEADNKALNDLDTASTSIGVL